MTIEEATFTPIRDLRNGDRVLYEDRMWTVDTMTWGLDAAHCQFWLLRLWRFDRAVGIVHTTARGDCWDNELRKFAKEGAGR